MPHDTPAPLSILVVDDSKISRNIACGLIRNRRPEARLIEAGDGAEAIAQALPADHGCLAERGLSDTQRASFAYFIGIEPTAANSAAGAECDWLLVTGNSTRNLAAPNGSWTRVWEGNRPGERKEKFRLYRR